MSNDAINRVLAHSRTKRSTRAVLLAIANRINGDGVSYPGHATIAQDAGVSERTVTRSVAALIEAGELELVEPQRHHAYDVEVGR